MSTLNVSTVNASNLNMTAIAVTTATTNNMTIGGSITFADGSVQSGGWTGMRNRIINGAMMIDQRNAGASVTNIAGSVYTVDRWQAAADIVSKFPSVSKNNKAPEIEIPEEEPLDEWMKGRMQYYAGIKK